ncbi:MAG: hypothetical protein ACKO0Z_16460 [Betaproteobacteria bacterium]
MATVYITQELSGRVSSVIARMRDADITANNAETGRAIEFDTSEFLTKAMWGEKLHLKDQIPYDWMSVNTGPTMIVTMPTDDEDKQVTHTIHFRNQKVLNRPHPDRWSEPKIQCTKAFLDANVDMEGVQTILQCIERFQLNHEIRAKWGKVEADVLLFLSKCKSLNEALKLWPGVKLYIPQEYINRVEVKIERKVREKQIKESVATDELTAAAIAAKLAGITA